MYNLKVIRYMDARFYGRTYPGRRKALFLITFFNVLDYQAYGKKIHKIPKEKNVKKIRTPQKKKSTKNISVSIYVSAELYVLYCFPI